MGMPLKIKIMKTILEQKKEESEYFQKFGLEERLKEDKV